MVGQLGAARDTSSVTGCGSACVIIAALIPLFCAAGVIAASEAFHRMDHAGNWLTGTSYPVIDALLPCGRSARHMGPDQERSPRPLPTAFSHWRHARACPVGLRGRQHRATCRDQDQLNPCLLAEDGYLKHADSN
jgi:hypothetical protein